MKKRGFITIATGNLYYYKLAANLLLSYRYHSKNPLPFAVLAEEENEYTALFDDVLIVSDSCHSFMDKFKLLKMCPYQETIFLDSDSLAYGDLNEFFSLFENSTDFSGLGENFGLNETGKGQYDVENIGKYAERISYKAWIHAGLIFMRNNGDSLIHFYDDCMDIYNNWNNLNITKWPGSYDEGTFGIAMPMNGMKAEYEEPTMLCFLPAVKKFIHADIVRGELSYIHGSGIPVDGNGIFLHFATRNTHLPLYIYEVNRLHKEIGGESSFIVRMKASPAYRWLLEFKYFATRCRDVFRRVLGEM